MNSNTILSLIFFAGLFSCAVNSEGQMEDKATKWFLKEYGSYFKSSSDDNITPRISDVKVSPSMLKSGEPRSEINAFVYDSNGIEIVYAEVGNRMNLMLDLNRDNKYIGYCNSNLPPGKYRVNVVAIDKAGNAAHENNATLTILDPKDMNANNIEDSLEKPGSKDLKVIVLHDGSLGNFSTEQNNFGILPGSSLTIPGNKLTELSKLKGVKGIYEDKKLKVLAEPGDMPFRSQIIDDPRMDQGTEGDNITVALIDTGVDANHESLKSKILVFKDFVNNQTTPYDDNGHGTHCASLIVGDGEMRGVAPGAKLIAIKVMDRDGACYLSDALKALDWCVENKDQYGIKVISFSVGGESPSESTSLLDEASNKIVDQGLVMCVAAGNSGPASGSIVIPGDAEKVMTVGAIDEDGLIYERSSRGPTQNGDIKPDLVTLGVDVVSALANSGNGYSSMSGTSMAVPLVAGASALLLQANPNLEPFDIKRILLRTTDDLGEKGADNTYGYGALNLTAALESLKKKSNKLARPSLESVQLNKLKATVGEPVMIEASATGDIESIKSEIIGPDRSLEIPMDDFDENDIYSARWETSYWKPGDYKIQIDLQGRFGEVESKIIPFYLDPRT
ncbi:MAG: S8 family peptidase [Methanotrichaceae archaeon]|nr:S8 family peptidase [Methanotrichaceae archaeon]